MVLLMFSSSSRNAERCLLGRSGFWVLDNWGLEISGRNFSGLAIGKKGQLDWKGDARDGAKDT